VAIVVKESPAVAAAVELFDAVREAVASGQHAVVQRKDEAAC